MFVLYLKKLLPEILRLNYIKVVDRADDCYDIKDGE